IKNLAPGKYGIQAVPPAGQSWMQTSTIEGTKVIDAWVKANEPPFFAEFGPAGYHVFIGFIQPFDDIPNGDGATIEGKVVNLHLSRPPDYAFYNGGCFDHTTPWVGLNDLSVGIGQGIYAAPTDADCNFSIADVPDGNYQLVLWDTALDLIFAFKSITISGGVCTSPSGGCSLGEVPVFQWFTRLEHWVYDDVDGDAVWDDGEGPLMEQNINLRWRDGTIYQAFPTDLEGFVPFDQVFPFFSWQVAEVDFARFQATGVTVVVDDGGPIDRSSTSFPGWGVLNPQDQQNPTDPFCVANPTICTENPDHRVETGPILTQAFLGSIGQTSVIQWGKRHYPDFENGGISGMVFYATTRAENDPQAAGAEVWEPGIPRVTVNLYAAGVGGQRGTLLNTTTTDSWDDSIPTGCKGEVFEFLGQPTDCYDGLRNFNQVRPGVFDGGYAFDEVCVEGGGPAEIDPEGDHNDDGIPNKWDPDLLDEASCTGPLATGEFIVEVVPPPGYELLKEEDKNVDFGDDYVPTPELLPPPCVGDPHLIPPYLTLFPDLQIESPFAWATGTYQPTWRPLCDRKQITLSAGANAAADFFLFTEVPRTAQGFG
ncbi:MAG: hypothetical protein WBG05_20395, partial [Thermoanaerobaculia bacterium]